MEQDWWRNLSRIYSPKDTQRKQLHRCIYTKSLRKVLSLSHQIQRYGLLDGHLDNYRTVSRTTGPVITKELVVATPTPRLKS